MRTNKNCQKHTQNQTLFYFLKHKDFALSDICVGNPKTSAYEVCGMKNQQESPLC